MTRPVLAAFAALSLSAPVAAHAAEPRTAAAVQAADDAWGKAEVEGNAAFVDALLLPEYVSVGAQGKVTPKSAIVDHTRNRKETVEQMRKMVDDYHAAHPTKGEVTLNGDTAVLRWMTTHEGTPVQSCDIFVYREGRWRAIYSQHTSA